MPGEYSSHFVRCWEWSPGVSSGTLLREFKASLDSGGLPLSSTSFVAQAGPLSYSPLQDLLALTCAHPHPSPKPAAKLQPLSLPLLRPLFLSLWWLKALTPCTCQFYVWNTSHLSCLSPLGCQHREIPLLSPGVPGSDAPQNVPCGGSFICTLCPGYRNRASDMVPTLSSDRVPRSCPG